MTQKHRSFDFAKPSRRGRGLGMTTIPEMAISMLPAKLFDKGPSIAVALGLCVGLSFGVGILSGWYSYRTVNDQERTLWGQNQLNGVHEISDAHAAKLNKSSLTFFDELRRPSKKEVLDLDTQPPPKHLATELQAAQPMNTGTPSSEPAQVPVEEQKTSPEVSETLVKASPAMPEEANSSPPSANRGDQMASALARLLGEPVWEPSPTKGLATLAENHKPPLKTGGWKIQVSAFSSKTQALSLINHLQTKGYQARLREQASANGGLIYPVQIRGFQDEDEAMMAQESLSREEGLKSYLLKP